MILCDVCAATCDSFSCVAVRERRRRSTNGDSNDLESGSTSTNDTSGMVTLSVEFVNTTANCSICTIDLTLNMSTVDVSKLSIV